MSETEVIRSGFDLDYGFLEREFDRTKVEVFLGKSAAFMAPLLCSMNFSWVMDIPTAQTNGTTILWNPEFFLKLDKPTRMTILMHELWHVAFLHMVRRGDRDPEIWNIACDYVINNMLDHDGYNMKGFPYYLDHKYDNQSAEEVYHQLSQFPDVITQLPQWIPDLIEPEGSPEDVQGQISQITSIVMGAAHQSKMAGHGGAPAEIETMLRHFLQPKIPWELHVYNWMADLIESDFTWRKPNRRHTEIYLPSIEEDEGRLECLNYYLDVSGSVSDRDVLRFNSEVKYIWETFQPKKLNMILFDHMIQRELVLNEGENFDEVMITGRGGTELAPVRQHILDTKPTAAIVFSDMCCTPMQVFSHDEMIPILWVGVNADTNHKITMGKIIYIRE